MSGSRRGRRHGWERERWKERQEREKKRETGMGERKIERQEREREIGRETGARERERERDTGEREGVTGRMRKNYKNKKNHGILSCRASIRLPETRWERKR